MCDGSETEHTYVDNPEIAARATLRSQAADPVRGIRDVFDGVERAMTAGAWTGGPARSWEEELSGRVQRVRRAGDSFDEDLDAHVARLPARVPECEVRNNMFPSIPLEGSPWAG